MSPKSRDKLSNSKLFSLVDHSSNQSFLNSAFRGIQALSHAKSEGLSVNHLSSIAGHLILSFDTNKRFVVFDSCSASESRSVSQATISRIAKFISHEESGSSNETSLLSTQSLSILSNIYPILAASSINSHFCHLQFVSIEPKHALSHSRSFSSHDVIDSQSVAHLFTVLSDGNIAIYRYETENNHSIIQSINQSVNTSHALTSQWKTVCSTTLPHTQPQSTNQSTARSISTVYYSVNHSSIFWVESSINQSFSGIYTAKVNQSGKIDSNWAVDGSVRLLPIDINQSMNQSVNQSQQVRFYPGINGLFIAIAESQSLNESDAELIDSSTENNNSSLHQPISLYYWDSRRLVLHKLSKQAINESTNQSIGFKSLYVHPQSGHLLALRSNGVVVEFVECQGADSSQLINQSISANYDTFHLPIKISQLVKLQIDSSGLIDFDQFFAFQQMFGVFVRQSVNQSIDQCQSINPSSNNQSISQPVSTLQLFNSVGGASMTSSVNSSMLSFGSLSVRATRHGGVFIYDKSRLMILKNQSISQLVDFLTSRTPYQDQQIINQSISQSANTLPISATFADPSVLSPFDMFSQSIDEQDSDEDFDNHSTNQPINQSVDAEQTLIPGIPYPIDTELALKLTDRWGDSLQSINQSTALKRWIGLTTARSPDHIVPPINPSIHPSVNQSVDSSDLGLDDDIILTALPLGPRTDQSTSTNQSVNQSSLNNQQSINQPVNQSVNRSINHSVSAISTSESRVAALKQCCSSLSSPALPLSLLTFPCISHAQHGHVFDAAQYTETINQLRSWLDEMKQSVNQSVINQSINQSISINPLYTPLNIALIPALESFERAATQFESLSDQSINQSSKESINQTINELFPTQLRFPPSQSINQSINRAVTHRATSTSGKDRSLHSLVLYEPHATLAYLQSFMGLDGLQPINQSVNQSTSQSTNQSTSQSINQCTPNLMLLNEEIKLKKELGVFGLDVSINAAALQRSESMPVFELLCRLIDRCQPEKLAPFVQLMTNVSMPPPESTSQLINQSSNHRPRGSHDFNEMDASFLFQRPIISPTPAHMNYFDRALYCLPAMEVIEDRLTDSRLTDHNRLIDDRLIDSALFESCVAARCELLARSAHLVDAVLLRLNMANIDKERRAIHEEAAIKLAYSISTESINQSINQSTTQSIHYSSVLARALSLTPAALLNDQLMPLRAELYNHLRRHFFPPEDTESVSQSINQSIDCESVSDVDVEDAIHARLDQRIRSLRGEQLKVHDYYELIRNQLASQKQISQMLANQTFELSDNEDEDYEHIDATTLQSHQNGSADGHRRTMTSSSNSNDSGVGMSSLAKDLFRLGEKTVKSFMGPDDHAVRRA